jgi:hypothetical protein
VAPPNEPGERLEVTGVVYAADGRTSDGHGTRIFEIVFEDDPFVGPQIRAEAGRPGSIYALQRVQRGSDGMGRLAQDVVLPDR